MATPPPYDPAGYNPAVPATWPQPNQPATLYQQGMAWTMTGPGTIDGQALVAGDLLFVVHRPRLYGDGTYGSGMYGSTPDADWTYLDVRFVAWYSSYPPADQPPYPYAGCQFGDTGWWIIIDAFYNDAADARHYGDGTYGSGVYGGGSTAVARWTDITAGYTDITISRGTNDGAAAVDVTEMDFTWYDPDWARFDVTPPGAWSRPFVGTPIRVSFYDDQWGWHPRAVGTIEQIVDPTIARTSDMLRLVTVQAFGNLMDLTPTLPQWQRPAEKASARFAALLAAAGWRFGTVGLVYPADVDLHADAAPSDVTARDELDRTALSAGWTFDTDRRGRLRLRTWPLPQLEPPAVKVVDCVDTDPTALLATLVVFVADESQLLNVVTATNAEGDAGTAGPPGPAGEPGAPGPIGPAGPQGPKGDTGATGTQGPKGDTGTAGTPGTPGTAGATGPQGPKGDTGATGATGTQGPKGDTGTAGTPGTPGTAGTPGATGPQGPTGPTGATGPQGPKGDAATGQVTYGGGIVNTAGTEE